jgi:two-component system KDP operon response regulator KdpE
MFRFQENRTVCSLDGWLMPKQRILIVDDDARLIRLLREVLTATNYDVITCSKGKQAVEMVALEQPDLVLLDIIMADLDGFNVARRVREFSNVPIIMLTAKIKENDILEGFEAGADDYITKPFSCKELLARVQAVLKRVPRLDAVSGDNRIECGDLTVDLLRRRVQVAGSEIHLTATEFSLLQQLVIHANQVLFHEQLLGEVWGPEYRNDVDYLRSYIHTLRKKIERNPSNPEMILNVQGVGYMLVTPDIKKEK